jgi:hypothetical protein
MAPQVEVATNRTAAISSDARRPIRSPSQPHRNAPSTVPTIPDKGSRAIGRPWALGWRADLSPYSAAAPGATRARVVGFITSIVIAIAITTTRPRCAGVIGALSSASTRTCC